MIGKIVRSPTTLRMLVSDVTTTMITSSGDGRSPASASPPMRSRLTNATT